MNTIRLKLLLIAVAIPMIASIATESVAQSTAQNWMRDYVRLRILEKNLNSLPSDQARFSRADLGRIMTPRIVGGIPALATDNPFQVGLLFGAQANNKAAQFCGGTLIREKFIVTAAHCSDFVAANDVQVLTEARMLDGTGVRRNVTRITIHPNWNAGTFDNDVAVWELATNAAGAAVATLASDDGAVGANLLATGWGHLRKVEAARLIFEESNYLSSRERTAMMQIHTMAKLPTT